MGIKVFVSSITKEFEKEREALKNEILEDPGLSPNIDSVFVFEEESAKSETAQEVFLDEVENADVYIGLIGAEYGEEYKDGYSAT